MNARRSAPPTAPQFLVLVHDDASVGRLPAAAAQAHRINGRLLVALAERQAGFTTDPAIARFAARSTDIALLRREREVHRVLGGTGVDYTTVRMPFLDSTSPARQARRLATAAEGLARRLGITPLPVSAPAGAADDGSEQAPQPDTSTAVRAEADAGPLLQLLAPRHLG